MQILGIHHIAIICSDYSVSKKFYTQVLGLTIINEQYRPDRKSFKLDLLLADNSQIELFSFPNAPARLSYPEAQGLRHLALRIVDIETCIAQLNSKGVVTQAISIDQYTNKKFTFFNDPDGLPIELYEN
jgi:glyoxylase I family protein